MTEFEKWYIMYFPVFFHFDKKPTITFSSILPDEKKTRRKCNVVKFEVVGRPANTSFLHFCRFFRFYQPTGTCLRDTVLCLAVKKTYSGKVGGRNDDLVISLQLALAGSRVFYTENQYRTFRLPLLYTVPHLFSMGRCHTPSFRG